jgi:hypothetical protein
MLVETYCLILELDCNFERMENGIPEVAIRLKFVI